MNRGLKSRSIAVAFLVSGVALAFGGIQGSRHDFSTEAWNNEGEICRPCHTPHNAQPQIPLWNHETTVAAFMLYSSPTLEGTPEQPREGSKSCLSCHDGSVAVDSYGGNTGDNYLGGTALIGTDLSDDHPISILWPENHWNTLDFAMCLNCHNNRPPPSFVSELPFFDGYVECATCHDAHNGSDYEKLLRLPLQNSEICLYCHGK